MPNWIPRREFPRAAPAAAFALGLMLGLAPPALTADEPTRAEILKGGLGPMRTCFDVTSYHLDVRIDPDKKTIDGSNKITFKTVDDFTKMQVDLWSNLTIGKVVFDEHAEAAYTRELNAVFIELPETVKKDSTHSVTVFYSGTPVVARRAPWDGGITWDHDPDGNPWVVVTCPETGASIWWPNKEHASDRVDNLTISITTPPGLEDVSNGRLKARTVLPDGWVRYDWYVSYPIDNYCVTFNIGKFAHFSDEYMSKDGQALTLDYYVLPKNLERAAKQFEQAKTMLSVFEKYFGDYPFPRDGYKLVECPHTGMEHQCCVAYGNHFKHQNISADDVFGYINKKAGQDLTYFFDQYFKHAAPPTLMLQTQRRGEVTTVAYRWTADVPNFHMPVKVTTAPGKYEWITPTSAWQTNTLHGIAPEDFKVAEDLFYANVKLRWSYVDSRREGDR